MRLLSTGMAAFALTVFAFVPANACSWGKSAKAAPEMTTADTTVIPTVDTDVSVATNDLSDETLQEMIVLPVPAEKPAE